MSKHGKTSYATSECTNLKEPEAGKVYKVRVGGCPESIIKITCIQPNDGTHYNGKHWGYRELIDGDKIITCFKTEDIVKEVKPKPKIDWSVLPSWADKVCASQNGMVKWYCGNSNIVANVCGFNLGPDNDQVYYGVVPPEVCKGWFDGVDWQDSLTERPKDEVE